MQIGEMLKEAREEKNISLDDIQAETKIQKRYLVAIEQDDFHALPGKFYVRAFIKEYAQVVGIDPEEVLQNFDEKDIEPEEPSTRYTRMDRAKRAKSVQGSSFWSFLPTVIVVLLIIGILFVAWMLYQQKSETEDNNEGEQTEEEEIYRDKDQEQGTNEQEETDDQASENEDKTENDEQDKEATEQEDTFSVVDTGTGSFPESTLDFTYSGDEVEVALDVSETSYVELQGENGNNYFVGTLNPDGSDNTYDVTDEEKIYIKVGNANGVTIKINDVALEYPVDTSTVTQKVWVNLNKAE